MGSMVLPRLVLSFALLSSDSCLAFGMHVVWVFCNIISTRVAKYGDFAIVQYSRLGFKGARYSGCKKLLAVIYPVWYLVLNLRISKRPHPHMSDTRALYVQALRLERARKVLDDKIDVCEQVISRVGNLKIRYDDFLDQMRQLREKTANGEI